MKNFFIATLIIIMGCGTSEEPAEFKYERTLLTTEWKLFQSDNADETIAKGESIPESSYSISVPNTVLAALVKSGEYKDIYQGFNMKKVDSARFNTPWWYVKEFEISKAKSKQNTRLVLEGINYYADIYVNGKKVGGMKEIYGAFRQFDINITDVIKEGKNVLAIKVAKPKAGDFTIGFVDWAPTPPDENMGVWRPVYLEFTGPVSMKRTVVRSDLNTETLTNADLTIETTLQNLSGEEVKGKLVGKIGDITFEQEMILNPDTKRIVTLTKNEIPELAIENPKVWWPNNLGDPNLYNLELSFVINEDISSQEKVEFGIRKVEDYFNANGHRGYKINGKQVVIKGGGWVDDLLLANTDEYNESQVRMVKDMNMNCIRFEGFWGMTDKIYSLCDKHGILAMIGFSCHWEWQEYLRKEFDESANFGGIESKEEQELVASYFEDQVYWLRNHPSVFAWTFGSDFLHRPELEKKYLKILKDIDPERPFLGAAKTWTSDVTGPTGVKMEGPYDWVPPVYWYTDTVRGGAYGFNTETGPGPQPPVYESSVKMLGGNIWPLDSTWDYHCGRHAFGNMDRFLKGLHNRYLKPESMEEFCYWSQVASYEAIRPMFEAFSVNKPNSTGVVQWMLNSAWPETFWQLYDYYLVPTGAYFGTKKACQPVNIVYNYGDQKVYFTNDTHDSIKDVTIKVYTFNGNKQELEENRPVDLVPNAAFWTNEIKNIDKVDFLFLEMWQGDELIASNDYWLGKGQDVMDPNYDNSSWIYTPTVKLQDISFLTKLPKIRIIVQQEVRDDQLTITLNNTTDEISFFNQLKLVDLKTNELCPDLVFWSDNYVTLRPGQTKEITVSGTDFSKYKLKLKSANTSYEVEE